MLSVVIGTALGVLLVVAIFIWVGPGLVLANVRSVELKAVAVYLGLTAVTYLLRALRFRALIGRHASLLTLCGIVSVHTLMVNLLPFNAGDLSYPILLKRYRLSRDLIDGVPSLLLVRLQDLFITGALLVVALIWLGHGRDAFDAAEGTLSQVLLALAAAVLTSVMLGRVLARMAIVRRLGPALHRIWAGVRDVAPRVWVATLAIGFLVRLVALVAALYLFQSVGIPLSLATVLLITTLYTLLPLLPVNVVAGIGVTEAYLVACLMAAETDRAVAVAASVQIHGLQLFTAALLAGAGLARLQYQRARKLELTAPRRSDPASAVARGGQR